VTLDYRQVDVLLQHFGEGGAPAQAPAEHLLRRQLAETPTSTQRRIEIELTAQAEGIEARLGCPGEATAGCSNAASRNERTTMPDPLELARQHLADLQARKADGVNVAEHEIQAARDRLQRAEKHAFLRKDTQGGVQELRERADDLNSRRVDTSISADQRAEAEAEYERASWELDNGLEQEGLYLNEGRYEPYKITSEQEAAAREVAEVYWDLMNAELEDGDLNYDYVERFEQAQRTAEALDVTDMQIQYYRKTYQPSQQQKGGRGGLSR
jgi:hypothetical protein